MRSLTLSIVLCVFIVMYMWYCKHMHMSMHVVASTISYLYERSLGVATDACVEYVLILAVL